MSTKTPSPIRSDSMSCQLHKFIEDDPIKRQILATYTPLYVHVFFVDLGRKPCTCRILLSGLEPNGYTAAQRNVTSMQYNEAVTSQLIKDEFSCVDKVYTSLSDDSDFDTCLYSPILPLGDNIHMPNMHNHQCAYQERMVHTLSDSLLISHNVGIY